MRCSLSHLAISDRAWQRGRTARAPLLPPSREVPQTSRTAHTAGAAAGPAALAQLLRFGLQGHGSCSHCVAQSTKLSVYEKRVTEVVLETKHLPEVRVSQVLFCFVWYAHYWLGGQAPARGVEQWRAGCWGQAVCLSLLRSVPQRSMPQPAEPWRSTACRVRVGTHACVCAPPARPVSAGSPSPRPPRQALAEHGEVAISGHDIAKLIGKVRLGMGACVWLYVRQTRPVRMGFPARNSCCLFFPAGLPAEVRSQSAGQRAGDARVLLARARLVPGDLGVVRPASSDQPRATSLGSSRLACVTESRPLVCLQALYTRLCEYLELEDRVELLNSRFAVLQVGGCANTSCNALGATSAAAREHLLASSRNGSAQEPRAQCCRRLPAMRPGCALFAQHPPLRSVADALPLRPLPPQRSASSPSPRLSLA